MKLADHCRLMFCALHIPTMKAGFELEACAQTEEQLAAANDIMAGLEKGQQ